MHRPTQRRGKPARAESDANSALKRLASGHDFATVIVTAMRAHMMRTLQLATIGAFRMRLGGQSVMATAHART